MAGDVQAYLGAAVGTLADLELGADEEGAFAHAADAGSFGCGPDPLAVVTDQQSHPVFGQGAQVDLDPGGVGVAGGVGEPFLGDAVEDEFGGRVEAGQPGSDVRGRAQA